MEEIKRQVILEIDKDGIVSLIKSEFNNRFELKAILDALFKAMLEKNTLNT